MAATEAVVLKSVRQFLDTLKREDKLDYQRVNTQGIQHNHGNRKFFKPNDCAGMADILVFLTGEMECITNLPITLHFECKSDTGKLSESQRIWWGRLRNVGHGRLYYIIRSVQDAVNALAEYGITSAYYPVDGSMPHSGAVLKGDVK